MKVPAALLSVFAFSLTGCGKSVSTESSTLTGTPGGAISCDASSALHWSFRQPQASLTRKSDVLLMVDTSSSMNNKRARLAQSIPAFLSSLPSDADLRVSVMLAHGGASPHSGKLYAASGMPLVLNSQTLSGSKMASDLQTTLSNPPADADEANGEAPMYSLGKAISASNAATIRAQGFFRTDAALTVVLVSDENDVCFPPELNGFTAFPDYNPSVPAGYERIAYNRHCVSPAITPDSTYAALRAFQGDMPLKLGGIIHSDPALVPRTNEEAIGHGILELVKKDVDGMVLDIASTDYSAGMSQFAQSVSRSFDVRTYFALDGGAKAAPESVRMTVDGKPVDSLFDSASSSVQVGASEAGGPGSEVDVTACPSQ